MNLRDSFSLDVVGIVGIILAILLLVLDKAGKLRGGWLIGLLILAGLMTLALAIGNTFVLDAPHNWRAWRGLLMFCLVFFVYSGLAIWISGPEGTTPPQRPILLVAEPSVILETYLAPNAPYPSGTPMGGIIWEKQYFDVRLDVVNGPIEIKDMDLVIELDTSIAGIGQISQFPGVTAFPANAPPAMWLDGTDENGANISIPAVPVPGAAQIASAYRVHCASIFANTTVHLVIASVALNPPVGGSLPKQLFASRRAPKLIHVKGAYLTDDGEQHPLALVREFSSQ